MDEAADLQATYLSAAEKATALVRLEREIAQLRAMQLRILAVAGEVAETTGARSAGSWLDLEVHLGHACAGRLDRLAEALDSRWHQVAAALAARKVTRTRQRSSCGRWRSCRSAPAPS